MERAVRSFRSGQGWTFTCAPGRQGRRRSGGSREGGEPRGSERLTYGIGDLHLPPGKETIPLEELFRSIAFLRNPTCYMELFPGLWHLTKEALASAREFLQTAGSQAVIQSR